MKEMKRLVHHHGDQIDPQTALGVIDQGFPDYCRMVGMIGPTRRFFEIGLGQLKSQGIQSIEADIQPGGGFPPFSYQPQSEVGFLFPAKVGSQIQAFPFPLFHLACPDVLFPYHTIADQNLFYVFSFAEIPGIDAHVMEAKLVLSRGFRPDELPDLSLVARGGSRAGGDKERAVTITAVCGMVPSLGKPFLVKDIGDQSLDISMVKLSETGPQTLFDVVCRWIRGGG